MRQFDSFGGRWLGETLLRQLVIIAPDELSEAFQPPPQLQLGANLKFTYVRSSDAAASSNRIGAMLVRMNGDTPDFIECLRDAQKGSNLVLCEDALWTGTETRKLMQRLSVDGDLHQHASNKRIIFRHCVVSDYGIWVCRHFLEKNQLDSVELWLGDKQRFVRVLRPDLNNDAIKEQWNSSPNQFDEWLSAQVIPQIFQVPRLWGSQLAEAKELCELIGSQLIEKYALDHQKNWSDSLKQSFSIGAGRFGCTTAFPHSIPKVCVPLFWLGGAIRINSGIVNWQPLFYDARRVLPVA